MSQTTEHAIVDDSAVISLKDPNTPIAAKIKAIPILAAGWVILVLISPVLLLTAIFSGKISLAKNEDRNAPPESKR